MPFEDWWRQLKQEVTHCSEFELANYTYDALDLQQLLAQRLRARRPFALRLYVDKEMLTSGGSRYMNSAFKSCTDWALKCMSTKAQVVSGHTTARLPS